MNEYGSSFGSGLGGVAGGLYNIFGNPKTPSEAANPYLNQIGTQANQYNQPFYQAGQNQLSGLQDQYSGLMNDPGGKLNNIGQSFQQSPGFQFALQQALGGAGNAAAAGGMAGSPQHQQQNMQLATQLGNQDYYNYLDKATGLYGQGLQGAQGMANQGQQAGNNMSNIIAQQLGSQATNAYEGQAQKNQNMNQGLSSLFGGLGNLAFAFL